jgi:acyl carrier protein
MHRSLFLAFCSVKGDLGMARYCTSEFVIDILSKKVGIPADTPNIHKATWEEIGVESLGLSEACANLERAFGIAISQDDASQTTNVQELVSLVNSQI